MRMRPIAFGATTLLRFFNLRNLAVCLRPSFILLGGCFCCTAYLYSVEEREVLFFEHLFAQLGVVCTEENLVADQGFSQGIEVAAACLSFEVTQEMLERFAFRLCSRALQVSLKNFILPLLAVFSELPCS